eukprot:1961971-Ditylum_brightwellii.AAC.1
MTRLAFIELKDHNMPSVEVYNVFPSVGNLINAANSIEDGKESKEIKKVRTAKLGDDLLEVEKEDI